MFSQDSVLEHTYEFSQLEAGWTLPPNFTPTFLLELYHRISCQEMFIAFGNEHLKTIAKIIEFFLRWNKILENFHLKVSSSGWVWRKLFLRVGRQIHETGETFILGKSQMEQLLFFLQFLFRKPPLTSLHCEDIPPVFSLLESGKNSLFMASVYIGDC